MKFNQWLDLERGRTRRLATHFGLSEGAISQWRMNGVPVSRMMDVLRLSGGDVTLAEMIEQRSDKQAA